MGIKNKDGALYWATGIDNTGLYAGRREAMGIIKSMASEITSFDVFGGIGVSAGVTFAKAAKDAYTFEKEFQKSMFEVATISAQISGSMADNMNQVMEITREIPIRATDAAKALYQIVSAGHDGADAMNILKVSARAAIGGVTDTATAADAITTILNAYKMSADQAEKISDQLFTTARLGKTTMGELGQSIAQAAPIAASYGIEIDQVLAAVATLTKQGTPTAQAMTQIRAAIVGVSKYLGDGAFNGRTFQEALELVRQKAQGSESKLREMVPEIEAVNGLLAMTGPNAKAAASDLSELNKSAGASEAAFKKMRDSADNQLQLLQNNITAFLRPMGEAILKEVSNIAKAFNMAFENGDIEESLKQLGDLIVIVTGAFIGYKSAIITTSAAKKLNMMILRRAVLERKLESVAILNGISATNKATSAELKNLAVRKLLNTTLKTQIVLLKRSAAAMLTNPYMLAAAAVAFLGYAVYKSATQMSAAEIAAESHKKRIRELKEMIEETKNKTDELVSSLNNESSSIVEKVRAYQELSKLYPSELENITLQNFLLMDSVEKNNLLSKALENRRQAQLRANVNEVATELQKKEEEINKLENYSATNIYEQGSRPTDIKKEKERLEALKIEYKKVNDEYIQSLKDEADAKEISDKLKEQQEKEANKKKQQVEAEAQKKERERIEKAQEELRWTIINGELRLQAEKISIMEEGRKKQLAQSQQEYKERKSSLEKEYQDIANKYKDIKKAIPENVTATYELNLETIKEVKSTRDSEINRTADKEIADRERALTSVFLTEEGKRRASLQERYDLEREWAKKQFAGGNMTKDQFVSFGIKIDQAQNKELLSDLLTDIEDFKSKEESIVLEWDAKMSSAIETGDTNLLKRLADGKLKALGELNAEMLQQSSEWQNLFENMDNLSISEIEKLQTSIREKAKNMNLDPVNMEAVMKKLQESETEIRNRNPFKALISHIKEYKAAETDALRQNSFREMLKDTSASLYLVSTSFDSVVNGLKSMGLSGDEETQNILTDISKMATSAGQLAEGIATKNPVAIIQGTVGLISSAYDLFDRRTRKANREIKRHAENLKDLQFQYRELERIAERAIGGDRFSEQIKLAENYQKQIAEINGMIDAEESKRNKKRDQGKIDEWENQIFDIEGKIDDIKQSIIEELSTTDLYSYSQDLAKSIIDGICEGLDNHDIIKDKMNDLMKNVIAKQFDTFVVQNAMKKTFDTLAKSFEDDSPGGFKLTDKEINEIVSAGLTGKDTILSGLDSYKKILERLGLINQDIADEVGSGVSGKLNAAITEGTASELVGLWNITALDLRELKGLSATHFDSCRNLRLNVNAILEQACLIQANTLKTANNTSKILEGLISGLKEVNGELSEIKKNTKSNNSRG